MRRSVPLNKHELSNYVTATVVAQMDLQLKCTNSKERRTWECVRMSAAKYVSDSRAGKKLKRSTTHPRLCNETRIKDPLHIVHLIKDPLHQVHKWAS